MPSPALHSEGDGRQKDGTLVCHTALQKNDQNALQLTKFAFVNFRLAARTEPVPKAAARLYLHAVSLHLP